MGRLSGNLFRCKYPKSVFHKSYASITLQGASKDVDAIKEIVEKLLLEMKTNYSFLYENENTFQRSAFLIIVTILFTACFVSNEIRQILIQNYFLGGLFLSISSFLVLVLIEKLVRFLFPTLTFDMGKNANAFKEKSDIRKWLWRLVAVSMIGYFLRWFFKK